MGTASPAASQGSLSAPDGSSDPPPPYSGPALSASRSPSPGPSRHGRLRDFKAVYPHYESMDPRSSSSQSLAPSEYSEPAGCERDGAQRRTLLIIYIHGFMGNDRSFRSFPAHIHSYLKAALAATHVIHSKIYPRYKTYKSIDIATAKFSTWLEPHESDTTDVILMGHSMGGILAADIVLLVSFPGPLTSVLLVTSDVANLGHRGHRSELEPRLGIEYWAPSPWTPPSSAYILVSLPQA